MGIVRFFHQFKFLRDAAKIIGRKIKIRQKFHNGYIFMNAVEQSWAWTGERNYTYFDLHLQNFILEKSLLFDQFIDIGSNVGVMTLSTLLRNDNIRALAIDANTLAIKLLKKSLAYNKLTERCEVINAVVGATNGVVKFDTTGSVTGHVADDGNEIVSLRFSTILNRYNTCKTLVKIDIEGYETVILNDLANVHNLHNFAFLIELHPLGFNGAGDPEQVIKTLKQADGEITDMQGQVITGVDPQAINQLFVNFN